MSISLAITAYIGIGSNLIDPVNKIKSAVQAINAVDTMQVLQCSSLYSSPPMGPQDQPDYINAVLEISTTESALELLHCLQSIENNHGRVRKQRWGARTLDLDILLYGAESINLPNLIVPHTGMPERAFVLYPLYEIAPMLIIPQFGSLETLVSACPLAGLKKL